MSENLTNIAKEVVFLDKKGSSSESFAEKPEPVKVVIVDGVNVSHLVASGMKVARVMPGLR